MSVSFEKNGIVRASGETINPNLLINTDFHQTYQQTSGWDTTKNGTTLAYSWGGYNSGVANPSTVYHAHMYQFNGEWVYRYIRDADNSWLGISQGGLQNKLAASKTYTFSLDTYRTGGNTNTGGPYFRKTGSTTYGFHLGQFSATTELNKWVRFSWTFTTPADIDLSYSISWYIYGGGNVGTLYMRRPKLEVGDHATPWCLAESEGIVSSTGGFAEYTVNGSNPRVYKNIVEAKDFIEW